MARGDRIAAWLMANLDLADRAAVNGVSIESFYDNS
jgi:hypothetical protein